MKLSLACAVARLGNSVKGQLVARDLSQLPGMDLPPRLSHDGSDFFDKFPLFPFTIVGGVLVQLLAVR